MGIPSQRSVFLDPNDPQVIAAARAADIPDDWIAAAQRSPIWDLIMTYEVALPLHPEYRTMPMVWYIPPLSTVVDILHGTGHDGEDMDNLFGAVDALRIPVEYLAGLFTAGDPAPVTAVLRRLAAMRAYQRRPGDIAPPEGVVSLPRTLDLWPKTPTHKHQQRKKQ